MSLSFAAGNYIGSKVIRRLKKKSKYRRHIRRAEKILNKYGNAAYALSCFVPVVRYAVPVLAGASRTKFKRFAVYSYTGVAVWTLVYFGLGLGFGEELAAFVAGLNPYMLAGVAAALAGGYFTYRLLRKSKTAEPTVLAPGPVPGEKVRP
ncbi:VTT domain-containing protein [Paenibacillus sp. CC-CFT747]|nr:VTT domain-containing protein [Paenibacillus sp. CC-CFT747]